MANKKTKQQRKPMRKVAEATLRHVRISPRKLALSLDMIRGKQVDPALQILKFDVRKGSAIISKLLMSAISNAREVGGADVDNLWVAGGWVGPAPTIKRIMPRARGSATPILKRSSNVTIVVGERA